jgi:hypothetical protein
MIDKKLYKDLKNSIDSIKVFDTHEHLMYESERRLKNLNFFNFFYGYTLKDLVSSGLTQTGLEKLKDTEVDLKTKWNIFQPCWEHIKCGGYAKAIKIALKDIYNIDNINLNSIEEITENINKYKKTEYYEDVLKKRSKIEYILNDVHLDGLDYKVREPDVDYFFSVTRKDELFGLNSAEGLAKTEKKYNVSINSLSDFVDMVDSNFEKRKDRIYAYKIACAYNRNLVFEDVSFDEAKKSFSKVLKLNRHDSSLENVSSNEMKPFQDYMYHYYIRKMISHNIPIEIHTGMNVGYNDARNTNPLLLTDLLLKYKEGKFDLFHVGYPFTNELIAMVKMYPHCYTNMCWIPQLSITLLKNTLDLLIDMIPSNKIFGFGGDFLTVEGTYGALKITRKAILEVLYKRVENKWLSFEEAFEFAEKVLYKNPKSFYLK